ncbi:MULTISPECIES: CgeB family protein [Bacillaceae]|uniref:Spore protein YkvP/CgeB glycosyl transferase-like domain-containing protein n=1 Tax=Alkalicoccobacillus plakortidis TaxID=444060 RepID=A0A9D5DP44_9BACI|nr:MULTISPECIES: glycosyltransferase [Bacillaceae]KQL57670.1 hypothetical protein AN965_09310 [Alkalicoccobacillus plakortidis]
MNVLLLTSPSGGVYHFFEHALKKGLTAFATVYTQSYIACNSQSLVRYCRQNQINWIITFNGYFFSAKDKALFHANKLPPLAVWLTEEPYHTTSSLDVLTFATVAWSVESGSTAFYKERSTPISVSYVPLGYDDQSFYPAKGNDTPQYDLAFVGYPYESRIMWLKQIEEHFSLKVAVVGPWQKDDLPSKFDHIATWLPPEKVGTLYRQSNIVLNSYRSGSKEIEAKSINNRTFEIAATATCQLSEYRSGIRDFFSAAEIATFTNQETLRTQLQELVENDDVRNQYALLSYKRVSEHTFSHRAQQLYKELNSYSS